MIKNKSGSNRLKPAFTGRIAGWSARRRWTILGSTLVLLLVAFLLNGSLGVKTSEVMGTGDARKGQELFDERFDIVEPAAESIMFSNPDLDVDDPAFKSAVDDTLETLSVLEGVDSVVSYYDTNNTSMISADRHVLMARLSFEPAKTEKLEEWVKPVRDAVNDANKRTEGFEIDMLGGTSANVAMNELVDSEFGLILMVALVGGFTVMVLAFGSVVAAVVPLLMALASVFAAIGAAVLVSRIQPLNMYYYEMIMLIGLAVGVDYSLFIINRFREERAARRSKMDAIITASSTYGQGCLICRCHRSDIRFRASSYRRCSLLRTGTWRHDRCPPHCHWLSHASTCVDLCAGQQAEPAPYPRPGTTLAWWRHLGSNHRQGAGPTGYLCHRDSGTAYSPRIAPLFTAYWQHTGKYRHHTEQIGGISSP